MIQEISGANHPIIKKIASLKEKKYRERYGEFLVEGTMSVLWALESAYDVKAVIISTEFILPDCFTGKLDDQMVYRVPPHLFAKMADTKTPQGILCTCALPSAEALPKEGLYIYCDRVRDPGNVGSIIRSADAMGFRGVLLSPESVDPFNPKLVRSTMGSLFHVSLFNGLHYETLADWKNHGFLLAVSALSDDAVSSRVFRATNKTIIAVGNEAAGVSKTLLEMADTIVKIPMAGSAESLNVAAAGAILMYEAAGAVGRI